MMEKIPVTPQMLRMAVKELQMDQLYVKSKNLREYIQKHYPVEKDYETLDEELQEKLEYAVCVGLLVRYGVDQYCIPTLRQEANAIKTALSAFWELYKNNNRLRNKKKKMDAKRSVLRQRQRAMDSSRSDETDDSEDLDII